MVRIGVLVSVSFCCMYHICAMITLVLQQDQIDERTERIRRRRPEKWREKQKLKVVY